MGSLYVTGYASRHRKFTISSTQGTTMLLLHWKGKSELLSELATSLSVSD